MSNTFRHGGVRGVQTFKTCWHDRVAWLADEITTVEPNLLAGNNSSMHFAIRHWRDLIDVGARQIRFTSIPLLAALAT